MTSSCYECVVNSDQKKKCPRCREGMAHSRFCSFTKTFEVLSKYGLDASNSWVKKLRKEIGKDKVYSQHLDNLLNILNNSKDEEGTTITEESTSDFDSVVEDMNIKPTFKMSECANCGVAETSDSKKLKRCAGCISVVYCSASCQKEHWKKGHSNLCRKIH